MKDAVKFTTLNEEVRNAMLQVDNKLEASHLVTFFK